MTIKCKAAVIRKNDCEKPYANSKPLSIEEISIDNPRDNEVLVKVKAAPVPVEPDVGSPLS